MVDSSRSRSRAIVVVGLALAAAGCSDSSTSAASRKIVGQVTISPGDARIPAQRFVGATGRAPLTPMSSRRARERARVNVVFRSEALGAGQLGAMGVRTLSRARTIASTIRARLATHPASALFSVSDVSPTIGAARLRLRDPAMRDSLIRALSADPAIASVSIDRLLSRGAESKVRLTRAMMQSERSEHASTTPGAEGLAFATAQEGFIQYWHYNLIDAPRAWAIPDTGAASVTVAVIDDGINRHPDIVANLDMAGGYDFVSDDTDDFGGPVDICGGGTPITNSDDDATPGPDGDPTMPLSVTYDPNGNCFDIDDIANHGLHVAGTIGATNGAANIVSGVNWKVSIRPIRALGIDGFGYDFDIAQAVLYAAGLPAAGAGGDPVVAPNRAPIINMSMGGESDSTLGAAVAAAIGAGSVIIASAGNDASTTPNFPASYPGVISVASLGPDGELASYTSTNAFVSLVAPGGDFRFGDLTNPLVFPTGGILSTVWDFTSGQYDWAFYTGTSMAAPHVSGVAALVLAANPSFSGAQLRERLTGTALYASTRPKP
jgi:subtilisin family serine protease